MKKFVVVAALAAIAALFVWLLRATGPIVERAAHTPALQSSTDLAGGGTTALAADAPAPRRVIPAPPTPVPATPAPASKPWTELDPDASGWIQLIVQDPLGAPIVDAEIRMTGLRSSRRPGTSWDWFGEPSSDRTAADGSAKLRYPVRIDAAHPTTHVSFSIEHPEFMTLDAQGVDVDYTPRVIVLQRGAYLVVSGWFESATEVVRDVEPHSTWDAQIAVESWLPTKDGRLACAVVPAGRHGLYLSHSSSAHGRSFSKLTFFDIAAGERKELHLQLFPGQRFEGRLDRAVPRPIANGKVLINLQFGTLAASRATMPREFTADVHADGTFAFADLPPGAGEIIGVTDGWASARVLGYSPAVDARFAQLGAEELALLHDLAFVPQAVEPGTSNAPFELRMEPTANVQATILDPHGRPLAGVTLEFWPSVHWSNGYSSVFMHQKYIGRSDEAGRARVSNIPRGVVRGDALHERFVLPAGADALRQVQVELAAGETREIWLTLEPREDGNNGTR